MEYQILVLIFGLILLGAVAMIPVFLVLSKIYPFAYPNARIRAMRSRLLREEDFDDLLTKPFNEAIFTLEKKHYPQLSNYLGADFSYASVDRALRSSLIDDLSKVLSISPEQSKKFMKNLIAQYDVEDIMTLIRSLNAKTSGDLGTAALVNVTKIFSSEFVAKGDFSLESIHNELKGTVYASVLDKHMDEVRAGQFVSFEESLNKVYFKNLLASAMSVEAKAYVKKLIDGRNVGLALKQETAFLEGGRIPVMRYEGIKNIAAIANLLREHGYPIKENEDPIQIEKEFYQGLYAWSQGVLSKDPLSEASLVGFVALDRALHRNVNILLKMKSHGFDSEKIKAVMAL